MSIDPRHCRISQNNPIRSDGGTEGRRDGGSGRRLMISRGRSYRRDGRISIASFRCLIAIGATLDEQRAPMTSFQLETRRKTDRSNNYNNNNNQDKEEEEEEEEKKEDNTKRRNDTTRGNSHAVQLERARLFLTKCPDPVTSEEPQNK